MKPKRISKDQYYLRIAEEVARRSTCWRRSIGAIIIRDDQIISPVMWERRAKRSPATSTVSVSGTS